MWLVGYSDLMKNLCFVGMKNIFERLVFLLLEVVENVVWIICENEKFWFGLGFWWI